MQNNEKTISWDERDTAPSIILNLSNTAIRKLTRKYRFLPTWLSALILGVAIFLPSYVLALLLGEKQQLSEIGWTVFSALQLTYLSVIAIYIDLHFNIMSTLRSKIIPSIASEKDLTALTNTIQYATKPRYGIIVLLSIPIGVMLLIGGTSAYGYRPGFGLPLSAIFGGWFMGVVGYYLVWTLWLTRQLGNFRFSINEFTPGSSRIIHDIQGMLNTHVYILALFFMITTIIISLNKYTVWFLWEALLLGWIPTITQFFLTQYAINRIISKAKWDALEQIQSEIKNLKNNGQLKDKETTDAINRLMDLHDRIQKFRNNALDFNAGMNFLNQLLLPAVGWIVGNVERLTSLIKSLLNITR